MASGPDESLRSRHRAWRAIRCWSAAALGLALIYFQGAQVAAQQAVYVPGNAAVTGFAGALLPNEIAPGVDPAQKTFIDLNGPSLRIVDLRHMNGPPEAQVVGAPKPITISAAQVGQVFGVALDDSTPPNIYVAATSAFGLPIVAPGPDGQPQHIPGGAPNAAFMPGLWGPQGGPGSIWKVDGKTAQASLLADVVLDGRTNSGAALGGLAYDPDSKSLFVADRETGFIHRFGLNGSELDRYDHGVTGRAAQGLPPVPWTSPPGIDVTSSLFDSGQPSTWSYAVPARRVFGLAVYRHRLYYAVAEGLLIWSVGLNADGSFGNDTGIELAVPPAAGPTEISKITFDEQGRMFLAERAAPTGAFDFEALAVPAIGRVLRYAVVGATASGQRIWQPSPDQYAIGFPLGLRNGNGGVAIGYSYKQNGDINPGSCGGFMWATGEDLRHSPDPALAAQLAETGPLAVAGLQGNGTWRIRRGDAPPLESYFVEYVDGMQDDAARGHMGDIAILRQCAPAIPASVVPRSGGAPPSGNQTIAAPSGTPPGTPPGGSSGNPVCPPGQVCPPPVTTVCPPGQACPPPVTTVCPPGQICPPSVTTGCPPGQVCAPPVTAVCPPGQVCPPGSGIPVGVLPVCQPGQTPIGPGNFCCSSNQVYTNGQGAQACCSGAVINGQCQPPSTTNNPSCTPNTTNPQCCSTGYVPSGGSCCLASQMTSTGVCCPRGRFAGGPDKSECLIIINIPTCPQCCPSGQIPAGNGSCCLAANVTTGGECCAGPVDPKNRSKCPVSIRILPACAAGYTKMPDATCCINRLVSADGKSCNTDRTSSKPPLVVNVPALPSSTPAQPAPRCRPPLVPGAKPGTCTCPGGQRLLDGRCTTLKTTPPTTITTTTTTIKTTSPTTQTPTLKPPKSCPAGEVRTFRGCKKPATTTTTTTKTTTKSPSPRLYGTTPKPKPSSKPIGGKPVR